MNAPRLIEERTLATVSFGQFLVRTRHETTVIALNLNYATGINE